MSKGSPVMPTLAESLLKDNLKKGRATQVDVACQAEMGSVQNRRPHIPNILVGFQNKDLKGKLFSVTVTSCCNTQTLQGFENAYRTRDGTRQHTGQSEIIADINDPQLLVSKYPHREWPLEEIVGEPKNTEGRQISQGIRNSAVQFVELQVDLDQGANGGQRSADRSIEVGVSEPENLEPRSGVGQSIAPCRAIAGQVNIAQIERSQVAEVGEQRSDVWLDDGPPPCAEREEVIVVCFNEIDPV
uniref:Uncharacterized protein n=1 Tax=Oryza glumipatula TaxID=40148 RepID=A0A0D9ZJA9_9ORYZ